MFDKTRSYISTVFERDPAAKSTLDILFSYPGVHALIFYQIAHSIWNKKFYSLARFVSHVGRFISGIEIHPNATIGQGLFIDHGMGVVIGETAIIGDNVTLYQGVTLGGTSLNKGKRHPTLEDGVIVGAGAKILGPITIGKNARVGSNAVVVKSVNENTTVTGIPAKEVQKGRKKLDDDFCAYGMPKNGIPDPIARSLEDMHDVICKLKKQVEELERKLDHQNSVHKIDEYPKKYNQN